MMNSLRVTTGQSCPIDYNEKSFRYSGVGCNIPERFKFTLHSRPYLFVQIPWYPGGKNKCCRNVWVFLYWSWTEPDSNSSIPFTKLLRSSFNKRYGALLAKPHFQIH